MGGEVEVQTEWMRGEEGGMSMYVTVKQFPTTRQPKFDHFEPTKKNQRRLIIVKHYVGISKLRAVLLLKYFILFNNVFILGITFLVHTCT